MFKCLYAEIAGIGPHARTTDNRAIQRTHDRVSRLSTGPSPRQRKGAISWSYIYAERRADREASQHGGRLRCDIQPFCAVTEALLMVERTLRVI